MRGIREAPRTALPDHRFADAATSHADSMSDDQLPIRDYLRILYRRRWIIVTMLIAGLLGGIVHNRIQTPLFQATATLYLGGEANVLGDVRPVADARDWTKEYLPTQLGILSSGELARAAEQDLKRSPGSGTRQVPSAAEIAAGRTVALVPDSRLVNIGFVSSDPQLAADVANALARAYGVVTLNAKSRTISEASNSLARQLEEQRKLVEASEAALQRYREQHGAASLFWKEGDGVGQNIVVQKQAELQAAVTRAQADTIEKEAQFRQLLAIQAHHEAVDSLPAIASNTYIQTLKTELTTLQRQLNQSAKELGDQHPEMIKLREAVRTTASKVQLETDNMVRSIRNDFERAQSRERALVSALERQKGEVQALNAKTVEYTALERQASSNREVLDKLLQRSREAALTGDVATSNAAIVDPAEVPAWPTSPNKPRNLMMAVAGSGALALALVFVLEAFNTRVTSPQDVRRHLRIPVLGVAPQVTTQNGETPVLLGQGAPAQFTELFQAVRTNLLLAPDPARTRTLLVTSSEPGEGKTTAAANLAISLARLKQRVLLIDADLRCPRLHHVFGLEQQPGLTDLLAAPPAERAIHDTKIPGLWVMPSGSLAYSPTDLLGSDRFSKVIQAVQGQFDWVLLDSPPVLAVTDPCLIARVASGVLFVVGSAQTPRRLAAEAIERLEAVGAPILGAVLNRVVLGRTRPAYGSYYQRDYSLIATSPQDDASAAEQPCLPVSDAITVTTAAGRVEAALARLRSGPPPETEVRNPWQL